MFSGNRLEQNLSGTRWLGSFTYDMYLYDIARLTLSWEGWSVGLLTLETPLRICVGGEWGPSLADTARIIFECVFFRHVDDEQYITSLHVDDEQHITRQVHPCEHFAYLRDCTTLPF